MRERISNNITNRSSLCKKVIGLNGKHYAVERGRPIWISIITVLVSISDRAGNIQLVVDEYERIFACE